jgi:hypothetical protein
MDARDHGLVCRGTDGSVVESLDALYRAFRCSLCSRVVTEWESEPVAEARTAASVERSAA